MDFTVGKVVGAGSHWSLSSGSTAAIVSPERVRQMASVRRVRRWLSSGCAAFSAIVSKIPFYQPVTDVGLRRSELQPVSERWFCLFLNKPKNDC